MSYVALKWLIIVIIITIIFFYLQVCAAGWRRSRCESKTVRIFFRTFLKIRIVNARCSLASSGSCSAECVRIGCASFRVKRRWRNLEGSSPGWPRVARHHDATLRRGVTRMPAEIGRLPPLHARGAWLSRALRCIWRERGVCLGISVCLSLHLSIYLSVYLSISLSIHI